MTRSPRTQDENGPPAPTDPVLGPGALRSLCLDLLGRPPLAGEREAWRGWSLGRLVNELLGGEAFWSHWYEEQLYYFLLVDSFRPASEGALRLVPELAAGLVDVRQALHRIVLTPSFDRRNPGADTFVTVVLEQLLGTSVQERRGELEIGKGLYDGGSGVFLGQRGRGQSDVVRIVVEDEGTVRELLSRDHRRLVGEEPDRRELGRATRDLHRDPGGYLERVRGWLLSQAYGARLERRDRPLTNRDFVRALHVDLLDRLPSDDEAQAMRAALDGLADPRPLRGVLARLLIEHEATPVPDEDELEDPARWLGDLFQRLLGRRADEAELSRFLRVLRTPACRPRTVLYALVSSPEYHTC